jgi:flavin reductase (DIM6/NTAB) family NADH-FMN oxidoreductase RutF
METENGSNAFDARRFRNALGRFASGVTVVTIQSQDRPHGMTANAFVSVSLDPPLVLVSLGNQSSMHRLMGGAGRCGISVLAHDQEQLSQHFAGRTVEGLHIRFVTRLGIPLIEGAVAHFVVDVIDAHPAGDHTLYICRVEHFESRDDHPLLFYAGRYQRLHREKAVPHWPEDELSLFFVGSIDPPIT